MQQTPSSISDLVRQRAAHESDQIAYTFLADGAGDAQSITWSELHQRASELAILWRSRGVTGQPVLLAMASGLRFVESLIACWYAGAIAVPVSLPRHARVKHRLDRVVSDAGAKFAIGVQATRQLLAGGASHSPFPSELIWLDPCESAPASLPVAGFDTSANGQIALLQYTSGSTGSPRGVVVSHANLMHNSALIADACGHAPGQTIAGWLPLFHDMGLVGLLVQAAFSGARCVFMSPDRFLMRPWLWLQMITDFNACSSPAPNFAYDLCAQKVTPQQKEKLNLSHWRNALNGSEPVRAQTLERFTSAFQSCGFSRAAFFPCYGLAEATLLVSGPAKNSRQSIGAVAEDSLQAEGAVTDRPSCGQPMGGLQLAIVDPKTRRRLPEGEIGEIWLAGSSCAQGYWNDPDTTQTVFKAKLEETDADDSDPQIDWLRTGDLGFLAHDQLYISGRLRELIIIAGRNLFPNDLEQAAESAHPAIAPGGVAAFSIDFNHAEHLVFAVELRREYSKGLTAEKSALNLPLIQQQISAVIATEFGVTPIDVILLGTGALPRTTSGKLRRGTTRDDYLKNTLQHFTFSTDISSNAPNAR